ncbi:hypothetical protein KFU94_18455 [Chloroflexi bacterium TSY]|nr:hypothetical protein [Chloroflexi bacterium TSY]
MPLFQYYMEKGETRDPGAYARAAILEALRPSWHPSDLPTLVQAVNTYEFLPPSFTEEAVPLRTNGLIALNDLDDQIARYHAVRLLADEYTERMSGEPARTALIVLGSQQELLPLYYYVMQPADRTLPELVSESLRNLTTLPDDLLPGIIERYQASPHDVILIGLFDLLLEHETGPHGRELLGEFLANSERYDAYQYLVTLLVARAASGRTDLISLLLDSGNGERDPEKIRILELALGVLSDIDEVASLLIQLRKQLR